MSVWQWGIQRIDWSFDVNVFKNKKKTQLQNSRVVCSEFCKIIRESVNELCWLTYLASPGGRLNCYMKIVSSEMPTEKPGFGEFRTAVTKSQHCSHVYLYQRNCPMTWKKRASIQIRRIENFTIIQNLISSSRLISNFLLSFFFSLKFYLLNSKEKLRESVLLFVPQKLSTQIIWLRAKNKINERLKTKACSLDVDVALAVHPHGQWLNSTSARKSLIKIHLPVNLH